MSAVLTFRDFQPGAILGRRSLTLDRALLRPWEDLFPAEAPLSTAVPAGLLTAMMLRTYAQLVTPRPPGNIRARQRFELLALPPVGARVTTELRCLGKEIRNGRRQVHFGAEMCDRAGSPLLIERSTILWAA